MTAYKARSGCVDLFIPANMILSYSQQGYTIVKVEDIIIPAENVECEMKKAIAEIEKEAKINFRNLSGETV